MIPERLNLWVCPACGQVVPAQRRVNIDEHRERCAPTIHKELPVEVAYRRERAGDWAHDEQVES